MWGCGSEATITTGFRSAARSWRFFAITMAAAFGGCSGTEAPDPKMVAQPFAGVSLKISLPEGSGLSQRWESLLIEWAARTGAEPQFVTEKSGQSAADLEMLQLESLPERLSKQEFAPIPDGLFGEAGVRWNEVPKGLATNLLSYDRRPIAVPFSCPVLVLYFRADLLQNAGLSPPRSWEEYGKLVESLERWAPGLTVAEPWGEEFRATMALARTAATVRPPGQLSVLFDIETGLPALNSEGWKQAWQNTLQAALKLPKEVRTFRPADCRRLILQGKAAMAVGYEEPTSDNGAANQEPQRPADLRIGISRLPGSANVFQRSSGQWETLADGPQRVDVAGFSGLVGVVSAASDERVQQAAWNLLVTLSEPGTLQTAFVPTWKSICRTSQVEEGRAWYGNQLTDSEGAEYLRATMEALRNPRLAAAFPLIGGAEFRAAMTRSVSAVFEESVSPAESLEELQASWQQIVDRIGRDAVRDSYRRQLGLSARGSTPRTETQ